MNISFKVRGMEKVQEMLKEVPRGVKRIAVQAVADYLIGDASHGLKWYPAVTTQKYVRTFTLREGWSRSGDQYRPIIRNYVPYAIFVPPRWKRYGWREWSQVIADNMAGALRHANALVKAFLAKWK